MSSSRVHCSFTGAPICLDMVAASHMESFIKTAAETASHSGLVNGDAIFGNIEHLGDTAQTPLGRLGGGPDIHGPITVPGRTVLGLQRRVGEKGIGIKASSVLAALLNALAVLPVSPRVSPPL